MKSSLSRTFEDFTSPDVSLKSSLSGHFEDTSPDVSWKSSLSGRMNILPKPRPYSTSNSKSSTVAPHNSPHYSRSCDNVLFYFRDGP
ncbi:hypothetical protein AVEN_202417-1 [Araneus ventricosus]|uniref:Uncharacterized protein n=1 Tax=Araneus ventricosus TaxID=182803 RepID=A0A4Y2N647_ARAVE|nr:hypothetical protein AVEN_202417-1 [Araneus ventricosus]